jgi:cytochrome bd-type quinol oxidase subunit 2
MQNRQCSLKARADAGCKAFAWGSCIATVSQGMAPGALINGFEVKDGAMRAACSTG